VTPLDVLDPRTLAASAALAGIVFSAVLWGAMRDGEPVAGAREWFYSAVLISIALCTNAMQDIVPDVLARFLANVCLIAACFLLWQGARLFNRRPPVTRYIWVITALALIVNFVLTWSWPSVAGRIFFTASGLCVGSLLTALELRRATAAHLRFGVAIASIPMFFFSLTMVLRASNALLGEQQQLSLAQTPLNVAAHLVGNFVLLTTLAGLTIIVNATRSAQVKALAYSDQLTNVLSRRGFYSAINSFAIRPMKNGQLFVFDIDRFKVVNDTKGHAIGDKLLKLLTDTIRDYAPRDALVARFGGDEFVVLADDDIDPEVFAEKVRSAFRERSLTMLNDTTLFGHSQGIPRGAEVSVGYSRCRSVDETQLSQALRDADRTMYESKIRRRPASSSRESR
jgi:diguanylate cyclase (GGDEF)-like protein